LNEIIKAMCKALGRKPPGFALPVGPTRSLIRLIQKGSHAIGITPPVTKAIIDKYTEDIAIDGSLIQQELGFVPQYDLKTGLEETIREMRGKNKC
jgi:UDP-glucose 4-epimerase